MFKFYKFSEFTNESLIKEYYISFEYKGEEIEFKSTVFRKVYTDTILWLYNNGYKFDENVVGRKLYKKSEISNSYLNKGLLYQIPNEDLYMIVNVGNEQSIKYAITMLNRFGVKSDTIKTNCLKSSNDSDLDSKIPEDLNELDKLKKMNFLVACQFVLKQNDNRPMNSHEIWEEIKKQNLVNTNGLTPWDTINAQMILSSINTTAKGKKKNSIFRIVEGTKPYKFILLNPDNIQDVPDEDEIEEPIENIKVFSKNPFRQAICVLGGSGTGKSVTIENILEEEGHEFDQIIPSASTTGLLSQFSPSKSGYVPSKLGKMIVKAYDNPTELFTAVFDECHKSNIIEMINDELLQAISTKRNAGKRFISLDDDTAELYTGTETYRGNILMPDNLGFIFISSKPDVIIHNDDFFNRIDIVLLKSYEEERLSTIDQLLGKVLSSTEKDSLKSNNE